MKKLFLLIGLVVYFLPSLSSAEEIRMTCYLEYVEEDGFFGRKKNYDVYNIKYEFILDLENKELFYIGYTNHDSGEYFPRNQTLKINK